VSVTVNQAEWILRNRIGKQRWLVIREVAHEGFDDGVSGQLIVAIGIRESGCQNIVGDGGDGRGWLQIDDRFHAAWLRAHAGCNSGSWTVARGHNALERGFCPTMTAGEARAIELLRGNAHFAAQIGVPREHWVRFAVASYNEGAGNAEKAFRRGGITNIDAYTTGRNYSADTIGMKHPVNEALRRLRWPVT
jgi:hypothetical protein